MKGWRAHDCSPFPQNTDVASAVTDKVKDVISSDKMKDVASKVKSTLVSEGGSRIATKGLKKAGAKKAASLIPGVGAALAAKDAYKFLDKHQVGQKAAENIKTSDPRRPMIGAK